MPSQAHHRIQTLDLLRGYFLFVIIIDHLFRFPGLFEMFSGRGQLWVSAAEGFFIISGLLVGLIYARSPSSFPQVCKKIIFRAGKLYFWSITLTVLFTVWGHFLPLQKINYGLWTAPPSSEFLIKLVSLQYVYGWADYLAYYVIFLLFSPLVILLLRRRLTWLIILISLGLWFFGRSASIYLAWQPLFFGGLIIGFYFSRLEKLVTSSPRFLYLLIVVTLITIFFSSQAISYQSSITIYPSLFDKTTLGPGRLVLAWIWFSTAYLLVRRHEHFINKVTFGFFTTLGRNSLFVYGLHAIIIFPLNYIIPNVGLFVSNIIVNFGVLSLIYFLTRGFALLAVHFKSLH